MVKLLADENIPRGVIFWLRNQGYSITGVQDQNLGGASDYGIVKWSLEKQRMILTLDEDFSRIFRQFRHVGIVLIKVHPPTAEKSITCYRLL